MTRPRVAREGGFSLTEALVASAILVSGLLGLAQIFAIGMRHMSGTTFDSIAREKAREAVESVHTARDTRTITWAQIRNAGQGGVFADGERTLQQAGRDGLVNTADDATAAIEELRNPGPDGVLGTSDDVRTPLSNFWRTITITDIAGQPSLRRLQVTIRYLVGRETRTFTLTTFVSSYA